MSLEPNVNETDKPNVVDDVHLSQDESTPRSREIIVGNLLANSQAALMGAVELHNKPVFSYRYEIAIILTINAWELLLKAYILTYRSEIKVFEEGWSKEFSNSVNSVYEHIGRDFMIIKEGLDLLYKYRCDIVHFYGQDIEVILYSLLRPSILYFAEFLLKYFKIDLAKQANLIILPIGFSKMISPVEFLLQNLDKENGPLSRFTKNVASSAKKLSESGFEDGLLCNYDIYFESVNKVKHADFVVGITNDSEKAQFHLKKTVKLAKFTNDESAPLYRIEEDSLFKTKFILSAKDFIQRLKTEIPGFREIDRNREIIKTEIKTDANCFRYRYLDVANSKSGKKGFYSESAIIKSKKLFMPKE